jgi:hypothetical protein
VSIREHTSAYVSTSRIRQHTSAYVSIRQQTSAYVPKPLFTTEPHRRGLCSPRPRAPAYVSIRQHTSAYVSIRQHTHLPKPLLTTEPPRRCSVSSIPPSPSRSLSALPFYRGERQYLYFCTSFCVSICTFVSGKQVLLLYQQIPQGTPEHETQAEAQRYISTTRNLTRVLVSLSPVPLSIHSCPPPLLLLRVCAFESQRYTGR